MTPAARTRAIRVGALLLFVGVLIAVGELTGLRHVLTLEKMRELTTRAGALGVLVYIGVFVGAELVHVPGLLFVAAAVALWGRLWGGLLSWGTGVLSVSVTFAIARAIGGRALADVPYPWFRKILARLADRPVTTVAVLRGTTFMAPTVTYALALTQVRFVDMLLGSALGMIPPLLVATFFFDRLVHWVGG